MLADPQTVTVNAVAKVMPRIREDNNAAVYRLRSTTDEWVLTIKHNTGKISGGVQGEGHVAKLSYTLFATSTDPEKVFHVWCTIQNGDGANLTDVKNAVLGLCAYLTGANIDKLLNGES